MIDPVPTPTHPSRIVNRIPAFDGRPVRAHDLPARRPVLAALVALVVTVILAVLPMRPASAQVPGGLDTTFGTGGLIASLPVGTGPDVALAVAVQPDGKIVVAGYCQGPSYFMFCLARLLPDGSLDPDFDGPGAPGNGKFMLPVGSGAAVGQRLILQPDDRIVVAGRCWNGADWDFCFARLLPDGSWDATFDGPGGSGDGRFVVPVGAGDDYLLALVFQPDGKIVAAGRCISGSADDFCLVRLNPDGSFDPSFDGPSGTGNGKFLLPIGTGLDGATALAIQPDGKILVAGACDDLGTLHFCIARLLPDGSWDTSFDGPGGMGDGRFLLSMVPANASVQAIALQSDGKIVLAGVCTMSMSDDDFCLARLQPDGKFDVDFDGPTGTGDGRVFISISTPDRAQALALEPGGRIVVAGFCGFPFGFCLARLHPDGTLDTAFDGPDFVPGNGRFRFGIGSSDAFASAIALQQDGKIVVAGYCDVSGQLDICLARLHGGPSSYRACSLDLDGDGRVLPTVDSLIHARVALGLTGAAVTAGISFPPHATRTSWNAIREFLVTQCGMSLPQ